MRRTPHRTTALLAASTVLTVLAAALLGGVWASGPGGASARSASSPSSTQAGPPEADAALEALGISRSSATTVPELAREAQARPSATRYARLGNAYMQRMRETGDPTLYDRAEVAYRTALGLDPKSYDALVGRASLDAARHEFEDALGLAQTAARLRPDSPDAYGIIGDAQIELGSYDAAFRTFDRMAALKPSIASYSRVSYGRELLGDRAGAIEALNLALDVGSAAPEPTAFVESLRGNLRLAEGRVRAAELDYRRALERMPTHAPAIVGLARVAAARGDVDAAVAHYDAALTVLPHPDVAIAKSDLIRGAGRGDQEADAERLARRLLELERASGVQVDLEVALLDLDRDQNVAVSLEMIERVAAESPSIHLQDAHAWALLKNDRCDEALQLSQQALRLGSVDGVKLFHRAEIERCVNGAAAARPWYRRALAADPHFSHLHAATARRAVA